MSLSFPDGVDVTGLLNDVPLAVSDAPSPIASSATSRSFSRGGPVPFKPGGRGGSVPGRPASQSGSGSFLFKHRTGSPSQPLPPGGLITSASMAPPPVPAPTMKKSTAKKALSRQGSPSAGGGGGRRAKQDKANFKLARMNRNQSEDQNEHAQYGDDYHDSMIALNDDSGMSLESPEAAHPEAASDSGAVYKNHASAETQAPKRARSATRGHDSDAETGHQARKRTSPETRGVNMDSALPHAKKVASSGHQMAPAHTRVVLHSHQHRSYSPQEFSAPSERGEDELEQPNHYYEPAAPESPEQHAAAHPHPLPTIEAMFPFSSVPHLDYAKYQLEMSEGSSKYDAMTHDEWVTAGEDLAKRHGALMGRLVDIVRRKATRTAKFQERVKQHRTQLAERDEKLNQTRKNLHQWAMDLFTGFS